MTQKKTMTKRRKSFKSMSVPELVKARSEHAEKIKQIDQILKLAVQAVGSTAPAIVSNSISAPNNYDTAFGNPSIYQNNSGIPLNAQVATSTEAPLTRPVHTNAPDQSTAFTIFDAESYVQEEVSLSKQQDIPQEEFQNYTDLSEEIGDITTQVTEGLKNVGSPKTDPGQES